MGLVTKERRPGEKELTILIADEGRRLLRKIPTTSLEKVFAVLPQERRQFARSLRSLNEKARSLLVPGKPPFMQYVSQDIATRQPDENSDDNKLPSDYILWSQLDSTRFAISRLRELELAPYGLSVEQSSILRVLLNAGGSLTTKDLEDISLRQHHSVSTLVNRMEKMGLVGRQKRPGESRYRVFITPRGKKLFGGIAAVAVDMTFSSLTGSEKRQLDVFLRSLYLRARDLLGAPLPAPAGLAAPKSYRG